MNYINNIKNVKNYKYGTLKIASWHGINTGSLQAKCMKADAGQWKNALYIFIHFCCLGFSASTVVAK